MGTGGTVSGVGRYLKEKNPNVKIIGVDPVGSLYYDFVKTGETIKAKTYVVEGIGEDFFPSTMNLKILDDVLQVNDEECFVVARRLVKMEGLFTGGSGGGCISATLRLAKDLGPEAFIVAFLPDTGMRYLSKVYNDEWMRERGYVEAAVKITAAEVVHAKHIHAKSARTGHRPAVSNRFSRAENHAGAGHFADSRLRRKSAHRHGLRRSDSEPWRCKEKTCASWSSAK